MVYKKDFNNPGDNKHRQRITKKLMKWLGLKCKEKYNIHTIGGCLCKGTQFFKHQQSLNDDIIRIRV